MSIFEKTHVSGNPFGDLVDAQTFFYSASHKKALHRLERGLESGCAMMLLTGEIGSGKTTIWRHLRETKKDGFIFAESGNPFLRPSELLFRLCAQFGIPTEGATSVQTMTDRLEEFCIEARLDGKHPVVVIDECHLLKKNHFSLVLVLSNLRYEGSPLVQIVIVGQVEVMDLLKVQGLEAVNQRIGVRCELHSMDKSDTKKYIHHKLTTGRFPFSVSFDNAAFAMIWRVTGGLPRLVNHLCANIIDDADYSGSQKVSVKDVETVVRNPLYQGLYTIRTKKEERGLTPVLVGVVVLALLGVGLYSVKDINLRELAMNYLSASQQREDVHAVASPIESHTNEKAGTNTQDQPRIESAKTDISHKNTTTQKNAASTGGVLAESSDTLETSNASGLANSTMVPTQSAERNAAEQNATDNDLSAQSASNATVEVSTSNSSLGLDTAPAVSEVIATEEDVSVSVENATDKLGVEASEYSPLATEEQVVAEEGVINQDELKEELQLKADGLRVSAIVSSGDESSSMAVINDVIVRPGGVVEGLTVKTINQDSIVFSFEGVIIEKNMSGDKK
ncbi:MAG: AAA family ATPase [Desulfovibrio sp.]